MHNSWFVGCLFLISQNGFATPWQDYLNTAQQQLQPYDDTFQHFSDTTIRFIATTCRQPGDILLPITRIIQSGTFNLPSNIDAECEPIRKHGFSIHCLRLEPSSIAYIDGFYRWNAVLPIEYYQTKQWKELLTPTQLGFTCSFGPNNTFKQFYVGKAVPKWYNLNGYAARINTLNGPIEVQNRTMRIMANVPGLNGKMFETSITSVMPQQ